MLKDKLTMVIHSCDRYSDLWNPHIKLLNENWRGRDIATYIVTDLKTEKKFEGVEILSAGKDRELSQRISYMLPFIKTEFILVTLDDYFPIEKIDEKKIEKLIEAMEKEQLDYIRLFKRPNAKKKLEGYKELFQIDLNSKKDTHYQVNMYVGLWRKSFIERTVGEEKNAWSYELSLTKVAREYCFNCAMSKGKEFEVLDVVRKGKLLHKAARYFKKHDIYHGNRVVISWKEEMKINIMTLIKSCFSQKFVDLGKNFLRKFGYEFYSDFD